jgi:3',5'-cyclic AMP phosphodiesterase CpdA
LPVQLPPLSRRRFIQGVLAGAAGVALGSRFSIADAQPEIDPNRLTLLSDIHVKAEKMAVAREINMWDQFQRATDEILKLSPRPAAALVNGDVAYSSGQPGDYATALEGLERIRSAGIPVHLGLGNHDHRANFLAALPADDRRVNDVADRCVSILRMPLADWYVLDSLDKTKSTPGVLGEAQIAWLAKSLDASPSDRASVVMVHHQPDDRPIEKRSGLTDTAELLDVLKPRKQVKALLFGHTHVWSHRTEDGLHFINLPTTAYVFKPEQPAGWVDAQLSPKGMTLQLQAITPDHPKDKERLELAWR